MIQLKNKSELERMKKACQISAQALVVAGENIRAGMTTLELDRILHHFIVSQGAKPSFLGYGGFPGTACISVNDEVIHGIPSSERVEQNGFAVVRQYVGHGVGHNLHEDPEIPNFGRAGHGVRLVPGMTIAIEPMVNQAGEGVRVLDNDWTVVTRSGSLSAHFEHTIAITEQGPVILTTP